MHWSGREFLSSLQRSISLLAVCCWAATFQFGPTLLGLSDSAAAMSLAVSSLLSPLAAALSSFWAASLSEGSDRKAWRSFGAGCSLYFFGNLCYVYYGLSEVVAAFPTWPELSYFLMAICFTVGMFQYGAAKHLISRIQVYNFALILLAAAVSASFLLHQSLATSRLQLLGTTFAFFYPVLWFSVAGFGRRTRFGAGAPGARFRTRSADRSGIGMI